MISDAFAIPAAVLARIPRNARLAAFRLTRLPEAERDYVRAVVGLRNAFARGRTDPLFVDLIMRRVDTTKWRLRRLRELVARDWRRS